MALKMIAQLFDDLNEETPADETVRFSYDGKSYEIDLSAENATEMRDWLAYYADKGRQASPNRTARVARKSTARSGRKHTKPNAARKADLAAIRTWAHEQGMPINDRGRIPQTVVQAYKKAQRAS